MNLQVKDVDLATGGVFIAILDEHDARKLDLHLSDRIRVTSAYASTVAVVNFAQSHKTLPPGQIGLFEELLVKLRVKNGDNVKISIEEKPRSLTFIKKKLDGHELNEMEILSIVQDTVDKKLTDTELTYYVAGNYASGMSQKEITYLTKAMINTGDILKHNGEIILDKHCIGGIPGNRTTPIVVPILAAAGLKIPKTSSRAITSPAGTADTMEVICNVSLTKDQIENVVKKTGGCLVWGGAVNLAPADDSIINVEHPLSIDAEGQLIASIMAKKGSVGATHVLIDIPYGAGSKIATKKEAEHLAKEFEKIGKYLKMKIKVIMTDGTQPIGRGIGAALEARDVMQILENDQKGPSDLKKKCLEVAAEMMLMTGTVKDIKHGIKLSKEILESGAAHKKFMEIIDAQGKKIGHSSQIKLSSLHYDYKAVKNGKVKMIHNKKIAKIARFAGCPKDKKSGIDMYVHKGITVKKGQTLFRVYAESSQKLDFAVEYMKKDNVIIY